MALNSTNRFYQASDTACHEAVQPREDEYRDLFQINRDRILHSSAFRALQSKTQVFLSGEYDFYRTRLTHSLEVAQIGRGICAWLRSSSPLLADDFYLSDDLVEASCLAHDLGHPPFGHTGERTLNRLMAEFGGFEGNAQTFRLLTKTLFGNGSRGMNPSRAFLDGVLKYKTLYSELDHPENHFLYDDQSEWLDFVLAGRDFPAELTPGDERNDFRSIECEIMDWADDTAYSTHDLEDGIKAGFITIRRLEDWAASQKNLTRNDAASIEHLIKGIREDRLESRLGRKIGDYISACTLLEDANFLSPVTNRHRFRLGIREDFQKESGLFKRIALDLVFRHSRLQQLDFKAEQLLTRLFDAFASEYLDLPSGKQPRMRLLPEAIAKRMVSEECRKVRARILCDYLAEMTDGSAVRLYRRLFDPSSGSILEMI